MMRYRHLRPLCLIVAVITIISLVGCGTVSSVDTNNNTKTSAGNSTSAPAAGTSGSSAAEQNVTLKIYAQYSSDDEKQPYDYALEKMKSEMPNVKLDLEIMAQDDNQKIKTYAATNNLPDIFVATTDVIESFKKSNNILMLDKYVKELNIEDRLLQSSLSLLKDSEGHTWAVPDAGQFAALIYYNKAVFDKYKVKVPENYDEFLAAVKTFKSNGIIPLALFAKETWPGVQLFDMIATREDPAGIMKLDACKGKASDKAYADAAKKLTELVKAGLLPDGAFNLTSDQASALFEEDKAAMYLSGAWGMKSLGTEMGDKVGYMYYPFEDASDAGAVKWVMSGGGYNSGLGVSPNSKYVDIAAKYTCLFSMDFAEGRVLKRGDPNPILKGSLKPEQGYLPIQQKYVDDSPNFKSMTCFAWGLKNSKFIAGIEDEVSRLLAGNYSVDEFIANVDKLIEQSKQ